MRITIICTIASLICAFNAEIIDYTRENYVLIENGNVALYKDTGNLFHITNLTYFEEIIKESKTFDADFVNISVPKHEIDPNIFIIEQEVNINETLLQQLKVITGRKKRSIDTIGTIWKLIAGNPDHNDLISITEKINDLTVNNNKQHVVNSKIFNILNDISTQVKKLEQSNLRNVVLQQRNKLIIHELQNLLETITLAKANILNTHILNFNELKEITKHESGKFSISDLMDASKFKIVQNQELIVIYIKYPKIFNDCKMYEVRAINKPDGKLLIENKIANCNNSFVNVENCKLELVSSYCQVNNKNNCLSNTLNNKESNCTKIKEKNKNIEIIKEGAILISGTHTVNNTLLNGNYLVTFQYDTEIDNTTYKNQNAFIWNSIKLNKIDKFAVIKYIDLEDETLNLENINIIQTLQSMPTSKKIAFSFFTLISLAIVIFSILKIIKIFLTLKIKNTERTNVAIELSPVNLLPDIIKNNNKLKSRSNLNNVPFF